MPYAFILDSPVPPEAYLAVNAKIRERYNGQPPLGLISHLGLQHRGGVRHVDVWESREAWQTFEAALAPIIAEAVQASGGALDPARATFREIEVIDTWLGGQEAPASAYTFIEEVPANDEIYAKIRAALPNEAPEGLVAHVVEVIENGLRYYDVWESHALWLKFKNVTLVPVVTEVLAGYGIPHTDQGVTWDSADLLDTWMGGAR